MFDLPFLYPLPILDMTDRPLDQPSSPVGDEMDYQTLSGSEGSLLGSLGGDRTDQPTASG